MTWKRVDTAAAVVGGFLAFACADFVSREFGFADAGAGVAQFVAHHFGGLQARAHGALGSTGQAGRHVPVRCMNLMRFWGREARSPK